MSTLIDTKKRGAILKELREQHGDSVAQTQELLKEQKAIRKELCQTIRDTARTVPEIAELTNIPASQVLWHVTAMKKYGLITEKGMCGEYYLYQMTEEKKK